MSGAKDKGTRFETAVVGYLRAALGDGIERRTLGGVKDRGDVSGVYAHGQRVVVECKSTRRLDVAEYLRQAEVERGNDDALAGVVVWKRPGHTDRGGLGPMGRQLVLMTMSDFVALATGQRPDLEGDD